MPIVKTKAILEKELPKRKRLDRLALQAEGDRLDKKTEGRWVLEALAKLVQSQPQDAQIIVDSVRITKQIEAIRNAYGRIVTHIHLTAPTPALKRRYLRAHGRGSSGPHYSFEQARNNPTERRVDALRKTADVVIDTKRSTKDDVLIRVSSCLKPKGLHGFVDVVIGGQYGSEGKGQVVAYLAKEYDLLVRVGGPNAGHKVYERPKPFTHHQLPSGTRNTKARLLIGPGAVIDVDKLRKEIADCKVDSERLSIDPHAMTISPEDIKSEKALERKIGSTKQGVGAATARRIMGRADRATPLAGDTEELKPFVREATEVLEKVLSEGGKVLLEGTQGTGLSLYHGTYPYVTSRDTTVAGCLSEAGIPPTRVRKIVMVCRTYPIRVEDPAEATSGPMSQEITWEEIGKRSNQNPTELRERERTSTTGRLRRVGEFDWQLLKKAAQLNGPTDIALTFADYLSKKNRRAKRFDQLDEATINFIEEIERVTQARVSLIATGFSSRSVIDRRSW